MNVRQHRLEEQILRASAKILAQEVRDTVLSALVVTAVRMNHDHSHARIYVRSFGERPAGDTFRHDIEKRLKKATSFIRRALAAYVHMRTMPTIRFYYDTTADDAERIDTLLAEEKLSANTVSSTVASISDTK